MKYRTQKAQGISVLDKFQGLNSLPYRIVQSELEVGNKFESLAMHLVSPDIFARPCPVTPRHGFVDSQPVTSADQAMDIWRKARQADPEAEMILMPRVNATCNAIYTGNYLALGPGHDGATGGKESIGIRTAQGMFPPDLLSSAGIKIAEGHGPYVEVVYGTLPGSEMVLPYLTQLRDGPLTQGTEDYIPEDIDILEVYKPVESDFEDLLSWEKKACEMAGRKGLVVWHPEGNIACHMAIHCVINKVTYITSQKEPKVGDFLKADLLSIDRSDPNAMREGLEIGSYLNLSFRQALEVLLFGLHQSNLNLNPTGSKLLGLSAALCMRLSTAACLGELRHKRHKGDSSFFSSDRHAVFNRAWQDMFMSQKMMGAALKSFFLSRWKSGYGGHAWGVCTMKTMELWDASLSLYRSPSKDSFNEVAKRLNDSVHTIHNGGWLFNKFANPDIMDAAAMSTPRFVINSGLSIFLALKGEKPEESGWSTARKTRALTEIRKKIDIDSIAQKKSEQAVIKLGKSADPELYAKLMLEKLEKQIIAEKNALASAKEIEESNQELAKTKAEQAGKITSLQGYAVKSGKYWHFQWKSENCTLVKGYYSCDIPTNHPDLNLNTSIQAAKKSEYLDSYADSSSKYIPFYINEDNNVCVAVGYLDGTPYGEQVELILVPMSTLWVRYVSNIGVGD